MASSAISLCFFLYFRPWINQTTRPRTAVIAHVADISETKPSSDFVELTVLTLLNKNHQINSACLYALRIQVRTANIITSPLQTIK